MENPFPLGGPWLWSASMLTACLAAFVLLGQVTSFPTSMWVKQFGVPLAPELFADLKVISDGIVAAEQGQSPYLSDVGANGFNYPKIWLQWRLLGLGPETLRAWGIITGLLFVVAALAVVRPRNLTEAVYLGFLLCSPVCLLLLERANSDNVIFAALAVALLLARFPAVLAGTLLLTACAKLFPVAGTVALLVDGRQRHRFAWAAVVVGLFGLEVLLTLDEWRTVAAATPRLPYWSFGAAVAGQWFGEYTSVKIPLGISYLAGLVLVAVTLPGIFLAARRTRSALPVLSLTAMRGLAAGTALVGLAYLLGNNFQYRLVFLLFAVPALWTLRTQGEGVDRSAGNLGLLLLQLCFWWDMIAGENFLNGVLTKQVLVFSLLGVLTFLSLRVLLRGSARTIAPPCV